jgi:hypothetical protein
MVTDAKRWKGLKASNYRAASPREVLGRGKQLQTEYDLLSRGANRFSFMKRLPALIAVFSLALLVAAPAAEAPDATQQQIQQVLAVAKEVRGQQTAIAENQEKIDAKLATIAESLRQARIYSSRGGGK